MPRSSETDRRRFGLGDAMIFVGATALALAWLRKPLEYRITFISDGRIVENLRPATLVGAAFAATWTAATLFLMLGERRSADRRRRSRPGFVACLAATFAVALKLAGLFAWGASVKFRFEIWYVPTILGQLIEPAASAVAGTWIALVVAGRWRRARRWLDDLGIGLGAAWLALYVFAWAALALQ